jgi:tetratricopeptide (TPR) repeat protein
VGLAAVLAVGTAGTAAAQSSVAEDDLAAAFEAAEEHYRQGAFEEAAALFTTVAETTPYREVRREALKYLGRTYIIRNETEKAHAAMTELIELEPPIITLDPEIEPPPVMSVYYDARQALTGTACWTGQMQEDGTCVSEEGLKTLAVIDFRNDSIDERDRFDGLRWGMPTMLIQHLNGATQLHLIERERLQWLKQEIDLAKDGYIDAQTAAKAGRLLGATNVMLGSYMIFDGDITIWARLVETESGRILLGEQIRGKVKDFHALTRELSEKMAGSIGTSLPSETQGAGPSQSLDAMLAYSDALKLIEDGRYDLAVRKLNEALEHDPEYVPAQRRLTSLEPMLAAAGE